MIHFLIIGVAGLFGLSQFPRMTDKFARIILGGQIVSIALVFIRHEVTATVGFVLFALTLFGAIIYAFANKEIDSKKRWLIAIPALFVFVLYIFRFQHYPGANFLAMLMFIPLVICIYIMLKERSKFQNELGFLTIIGAEALLAVLSWVELLVE